MDFVTNPPKVGSVIEHANPCVALSYHASGNHLFVGTEVDSKVTLVDALRTGQPTGPAYRCDREGVSCLAATHNDYCVLTAGKKATTVQYWSLYDNKMLRKFRGHTASVSAIDVCPTEDMFLTSGTDRTVRLWNLQEAGCQAKMELPTKVAPNTVPHAVFDATGMVFCVLAEMAGGAGHYLHLYDARNYSGGAFSELTLESKSVSEALATHRVPPPPPPAPGTTAPPLRFRSMEFNARGDRILVTAPEDGYAVVLDGYEGTVQRIFRSTVGTCKVACFSPDERSVLLGSDADGLVDVYDLQSGSALAPLAGGHGHAAGGVHALAFNPKYAQVASGGTSNTRCVSEHCVEWNTDGRAVRSI